MGLLEGEKKPSEPCKEPPTKWSHMLLCTLIISYLWNKTCTQKNADKHTSYAALASFITVILLNKTYAFGRSSQFVLKITCWEMDTLPGSFIFYLYCRLLSFDARGHEAPHFWALHYSTASY